MKQSDADSRRGAIREILGGRPVGSQGELLRRLGARGIHASQATLSRDMAILGVRRAVGPDGPRYHVDGNGGALPLDPVRRLVDGVESNGALVIVRTKSSAAAAVARALDEAGLAEVMGTLAGDDTVFVAPRRTGGGHRVAGKLRVLFGLV
ncbi:MAG TPA: arginine repressor [Polyangia bacterium]|jgi:transcriptional regulator of arginine metabolism|nr:arginine repressor [Polyangia bacterium]